MLPLALALAVVGFTASQSTDDPFRAGKLLSEFGRVAAVQSDVEIPEGTVFRVRFDVGRKASANAINSTFDSAARFLNVNVAAGMPAENLEVAIVVHGSASQDVTGNAFYGPRNEGRPNRSERAVAALRKHGAQFFLCGQSAAYHGIGKGDLLPGVKIAPSAMTAHALLDLQGFSLNPF